MFGYVRPMRGELKVKEFDAYRAAYCGLCHTLGQRYGFVARMTLNYDFTFLAMLLAQREGRDGTFCQRRCPVHPTQKKTMCVAGEGMEIAADESVILTYWKLRDNVSDRGFWKGLPHRCAARLLRGAYRKAAALRPEFDSTVTACLKELGGLEEAGSPSLDRTADTFARILSAAAPAGPDETANRALGQILYHVGRWIYIVDGVDDLAEDEAAGAYNPVAARFAGHPDNEYLRKTLQNSRSLACAALELVDFGSWSEILRNILYLGLPMVEDLVFTGRWREAQKTIGRTTNE
ncbi:MAG: DUF5685 family protein [Oscillospiraceae bacterium]